MTLFISPQVPGRHLEAWRIEATCLSVTRSSPVIESHARESITLISLEQLQGFQKLPTVPGLPHYWYISITRYNRHAISCPTDEKS